MSRADETTTLDPGQVGLRVTLGQFAALLAFCLGAVFWGARVEQHLGAVVDLTAQGRERDREIARLTIEVRALVAVLKDREARK